MRKFQTLIFFTLIALVQLSCQNEKTKLVFKNNSAQNPTEINALKKYVLMQKSINSDFQYSKLDNIDEYNKIESFEPTNGKFTYYRFIATFKGYTYIAPDDSDENIKTFHDILIVKTNINNQIIDAYQYTLEWAEMPFQYDVYKSKTDYVVLKSNLDIMLLNLTRTDYWNENDKMLNENGIIKLE